MTTFVNVLKQADIFYGLTPTQLEMIAALCEERTYDSRGIICQENDRSDELFVIAQGEVDILVNPALVSDRPGDHQATVIATLRRGQSFGEIALVDEGLRSATARAAASPTHLLVLPRPKLLVLCEAYPQLGYRLMYNLAADLALKLRNTDMMVREKLLYGKLDPRAKP